MLTAASLRELARAEHNEGEIGGDAYNAFHEAVSKNAKFLAAALEVAEADLRYQIACEDKKMHEEANVRAGGMRSFGMMEFDREVAESIIRKTEALSRFRAQREGG